MCELTEIDGIRIYSTAMPADIPRGERHRVEQDAVARLVVEAFGQGAVKVNDADGRPWVLMPDGSRRPVTVSHCAACAVIAVPTADNDSIGIDVETPRAQLPRVLPRILTQAELATIAPGDIEAMLRAWTLTEALYKASGTPGTDYRRDISILPGRPTVATVPHIILHSAPFSQAWLSLVKRV